MSHSLLSTRDTAYTESMLFLLILQWTARSSSAQSGRTLDVPSLIGLRSPLAEQVSYARRDGVAGVNWSRSRLFRSACPAEVHM
ncbi:unnamed protein product [Arctogadus glacialis]